jgi:hypothetical protein
MCPFARRRESPRDQHKRVKLLFPIAGRVKELLDDLDRRAYREKKDCHVGIGLNK